MSKRIERGTKFLVYLAISIYALGCSREGTPASGPQAKRIQAVETSVVVRQDLAETLNLVGSLAANESATLRPETSGLIRQITFDEGQTVAKGDLLVKIDDTELLAQKAEVEARFKLTELTVARSETLRGTNTIPQSELDTARANYASAKAELALLQSRLEKTSIRAPFAGIAGARELSPGDYVTTATTITTVDDLSRLKVEFEVPERVLNRVAPGAEFVVVSRAEGEPRSYRGMVYFVSPVINRQTRSSQVKGFLEAPPAALKPGMFANVSLVLEVHRNVLTIPEAAVLTLPTGPQVIKVIAKDGGFVAAFVPVRLGLREQGLVEVQALNAGLAESDQIVSSGVGGLVLYPDAPVEPRPLKDRVVRVGE